jgi:hypothetical protein
MSSASTTQTCLCELPNQPEPMQFFMLSHCRPSLLPPFPRAFQGTSDLSEQVRPSNIDAGSTKANCGTPFPGSHRGVGELVLRKRASCFHRSYNTIFALLSLYAVQAQTTHCANSRQPSVRRQCYVIDRIVSRTAGASSWDDKIAFRVY